MVKIAKICAVGLLLCTGASFGYVSPGIKFKSADILFSNTQHTQHLRLQYAAELDGAKYYLVEEKIFTRQPSGVLRKHIVEAARKGGKVVTSKAAIDRIFAKFRKNDREFQHLDGYYSFESCARLGLNSKLCSIPRVLPDKVEKAFPRLVHVNYEYHTFIRYSSGCGKSSSENCGNWREDYLKTGKKVLMHARMAFKRDPQGRQYVDLQKTTYLGNGMREEERRKTYNLNSVNLDFPAIMEAR